MKLHANSETNFPPTLKLLIRTQLLFWKQLGKNKVHLIVNSAINYPNNVRAVWLLQY